MSQKACRIMRLTLAPYTTFNVWDDNSELVKFLNKECDFEYGLGENGNGIIRVPVATLEHALESLNLRSDEKEHVQYDINAAKKIGEEFVLYFVWYDEMIERYRKPYEKPGSVNYKLDIRD